jgi:hypothetical protein
MNLRHSLAALTLAFGSLVSMPAFAQSQPLASATVVRSDVVVRPAVAERPAWRAQPAASAVVIQRAPAPIPAPVVVLTPAQAAQAQRIMAQRRQTAEFSARAQAQATQIEAQVRTGVAQGRLRAIALQHAATLHTQLNRALETRTRDGVLGAQDQRQINRLLSRMARLEAQFRIQVRAGARR